MKTLRWVVETLTPSKPESVKVKRPMLDTFLMRLGKKLKLLDVEIDVFGVYENCACNVETTIASNFNIESHIENMRLLLRLHASGHRITAIEQLNHPYVTKLHQVFLTANKSYGRNEDEQYQDFLDATNEIYKISIELEERCDDLDDTEYLNRNVFLSTLRKIEPLLDSFITLTEILEERAR